MNKENKKSMKNLDPEIVLGDNTTKVFYNCTYRGNDLPDDLKSFYEYVETGRADTDLTRRIDTAVEKGRKNEMWRSEYMKEMTIIMDAREEGREEERRNTEKEYKRAEKERKRAETAERRVAELEALLAKK